MRPLLVHTVCSCCYSSRRRECSWNCHECLKRALERAGFVAWEDFRFLGGRNPWLVIGTARVRVYSSRESAELVPVRVQEALELKDRWVKHKGRIWVRATTHGCFKRTKNRIASVRSKGLIVVQGGEIPEALLHVTSDRVERNRCSGKKCGR